MDNQSNWYSVDNAAGLDTPALLIYPDRIKENIRRLIQMVSSVDVLRPHVKTNKSSKVSQLMIDAGINKFKCATITEAAMLGRIEAADVLLAYQPTQTKLTRLVQLIQNHPKTKFSCLVDNESSAAMLSATAKANNLTLSVYIDLNVGMDRTGIRPENALPLFNYLTALPGINFKGLHAYDGHINNANLATRTVQCQQAFAPVEQLREAIQALGYAEPLLVAGGSPTLTLHAGRLNTECSPGTFIFWDKGYTDYIPEQDFLWASAVLARVASFPAKDKICLDLGYKAIACEKALENRLYVLNAPHLTAHSQSEEHLVLEAPTNHPYKIGDEFYVLPVHICPTVAMYNKVQIINNSKYVDDWAIDGRDR